MIRICKYIGLATLVTLISMGTAYAGCGLSGKVSILSNSFPTFDIFTNALNKCKDGEFSYQWKKTPQHKTEQVSAFAGKVGPYDAAFVANSSISTVQSRGLLRPLDDLVAKYRHSYDIQDNMLVRIDGKIYAIGFMVNAQHLMYRKDLFAKHNIPVPQTYDDVLAAAAILKEDDTIAFPFGAAYKSGWNAAQEFNNLYQAFGGTYFKAGTFEASIVNANGIKALELMAKLKQYMSPNALVIDSGVVQQMLRNGKLGMALLWGNRAAAVDDKDVSAVVGKIALVSAPKVSPDSNAAATVFWDGFVLPKNAPGDVENTFKTMMYLYSRNIVAQNNDAAIWLRDNYKIGKYAKGVVETVENNAPPFPMTPAYTYLHNAIGKFIGEYLTGQKTATEVLQNASKEYTKVAKENGIL